MRERALCDVTEQLQTKNAPRADLRIRGLALQFMFRIARTASW